MARSSSFPARRWLTRGRRLIREGDRRQRMGSAAVVLAIVAAAVIAWRLGTPAPVPAKPGPLAPSLLPYAAERAGALSIARDCGYAAPLPAAPGTSLWLFCDTPVYTRKAGGWTLGGFVPGSTAALGPDVTAPAGSAPGSLAEAATPRVTSTAPQASRGPAAPGGLEEFLRPPAGLHTQAGRPCGSGGSYSASWISGVARVPSTADLLITFGNYCVIRSGAFQAEGFGLVEYDPANRTLSNDVTVFRGQPGSPGNPLATLGSPVFNGGYLYLFGPACEASLGGRCGGTMIEARVAATRQAWSSRASYEWRAAGPAGPWTSDPAAATALIPGPKGAAQDVTDFAAAGHGLVLIEQTDVTGGFTVYQAPGPGGSWSRVMSGRVACQGVRPGYANFCRSLIAHPELSSRSELVMSYFDPSRGPGGHLMVEGFRW